MQRMIVRAGIVVALLMSLAGISARAAAPAKPTGYINMNTYDGDQRAGIRAGTATPDGKYYPKRMEGPYNGFPGPDAGDDTVNPPGDTRNNYNTELVGYFYPPKDGNVMLAISTDDPGELWLSTDENPANKVQIASESQWNGIRAFAGGDPTAPTRRNVVNDGKAPSPRPENWSPYIKVTKGKPYYIQAIATEYGGGDNCAVAFRYEGDPDFADGDKPISGDYLAPFSVPASLVIINQPKDAAAYVGSKATFKIGIDMPPTATLNSVKWQRNGVDIPGADTTTLTVTAALADDGAKYKAVVSSSAGNATSSEATLTVASITSEFAQGVVKFEAWTGIGGTAVSALTDDAHYQDPPDDTRLLGALDTPNSYGENYGARVTGFIIPPADGDYRFFTRSDDASQFLLSKDENPANAVLIAEETGCCDGFKEPDDASAPSFETSTAQTLKAGKKYAFIAFVKEGGGGDYLQVAWRKEGDATPAGALKPIAGAFIGANAKPNKGDPSITVQPQGIAKLEQGRKATLAVDGVVAPAAFNFPLLVQWQKDGANIPGANGKSYTIASAKSSDSGTYRAIVSAPSGKSVTSSDAVVNVVPDTFPPVPTAGAILNNGKQEVGITFDELVDPAALGVAANYSIDKGKIDSVSVVTRPTTGFSPDLVASGFVVPEYYAAKLIVSGLNPGDKATVTVKNIKDTKGNTISSATASFTAEGSIKWAVVGAAEAGAGFVNDVVRVGDEGFDLLSGGVAFWSNYDELTMVYEEITGDFDKTVQLVYQDPSSQWARTGLQARESLDAGKGRPDPDGTCPQFILEDGSDCLPRAKWFSRLQDVHANATIRWDAGVSNNAYENHYRNDDTYKSGTQLNSADGGYGPLDYDGGHVWMRIKRTGDTMSVYRSTDGVNWFIMTNSRKFNNLAAKLYVGPYYGPELGNNGAKDGLGHSVLAQFRNYRNFGAAPSGGGGTPPALSIAVNNGKVVITFEGTLQSSDTVTGTFADVAGATSPFTADTSKGAKFYKAKK